MKSKMDNILNGWKRIITKQEYFSRINIFWLFRKYIPQFIYPQIYSKKSRNRYTRLFLKYFLKYKINLPIMRLTIIKLLLFENINKIQQNV